METAKQIHQNWGPTSCCRGQDDRVGDPSLHSFTKIFNQTAIHKQKQLWESSRVQLRNFSNTAEQKKKRITAQNKRGRIAPFACIMLSPRPLLLSTKREFHIQKEFPSPEKEEQSGQPASPAFQSTAQKNCLNFTPAKLRHVEITRKNEEKQGILISVTQWEQLRFPVTCSVEDPRGFCH